MVRRPTLVALYVRIPTELRDQLDADALKTGRSLAEHIRALLNVAVRPDDDTRPGERS
jgi:predicted HicB family RNase H-like nuclease